jgi:hypothetical protein
MNRREFGKRVARQTGIALAASSLVASGPAPGSAAAARARKPERSPHVEALELVFQKAADRIRAVDRENWWHDVKERTWAVQRPFAPGSIDSTHLFDVNYRIGGKQVAAWQVDTRAGTVTEVGTSRRKRSRSG